MATCTLPAHEDSVRAVHLRMIPPAKVVHPMGARQCYYESVYDFFERTKVEVGAAAATNSRDDLD